MAEQNRLMPSEQVFRRKLNQRQQVGSAWGRFFSVANVIAIIALLALAYNIANRAFGYVAVRNRVNPEDITPIPLDDLTEPQIALLLQENAANQLRVIIRDTLSRVPNEVFTTTPLEQVLRGSTYPPEIATLTINDTSVEQQLQILSDNLSRERMEQILEERVIQPQIVRSWSLVDSLFREEAVRAEHSEKFADTKLEFYSWLRLDFITSPISSSPTTAGLRTALLGSMWVLLITVSFAFPVGVGAAIYLEEYSSDSWFERIIETNIRNLAGVPSIIYGMLGLAVFVRALGEITSGAFLGIEDSNGRTVLSAGLTLGLLILPVIIINAQEAIRAVPSSVREASYGLGATKWQTIWRQVLPIAFPGIMTGMILSMSRAVGETAPLIVVGASTFIGIDPNGPFSKFTVVPIQIYQWTSRPELEFKNAAAAGIIVLMAMLLLLNGTAILLRNRFSKYRA